MTKDVEAIAEAIYYGESGDERRRPIFGSQPQTVRNFYFAQARAAIAAHKAHLSATGYAILPVTQISATAHSTACGPALPEKEDPT